MENTNYLKKELYERLKSDEYIFDFIQESCLDGLWYWDLEHPEEEWMNPKFWDVLGYDYREMPHKASAWQSTIHPEDLKLARENLIKHCENPDYPYDQTVRYTHKNGSTVWIRCRGLAIRDEQGKPIRMLGAHQEITDLKSNELSLQRNTELLRTAQQISKTGSWELDVKTEEVLWTKELYQMYDFDPTLPPPPFSEHGKLFTPESWAQLEAAVALTIEQGIPYELELKTLRKDGVQGWVWVRGEAVLDENEEIVALRGIAQDITDRKNIELEKEALTKRLNYALDASGDGIWDWDLTTGKVTFSKAWIEMLGHEVDELEPSFSTWMDRLHPDDAEWVVADIAKVIQSPENGDTYSQEYRFRNKEGQYLWVFNRGKVVERNEKGEALRAVGTHTNITDRKKAEKEIKRTTLLLEAAQKLAKMGAWELDLATGKTFWTDEIYNIHEVEKSFDHNEANGIEFYHPDYRPIISKAITDSIEQQRPFDVKCKFITAKNNLRWIHISGYPVIKEGKVTHLIGMFKDITQEEADKEAIVQEQSFSKQLLENMADGFSVIDVEGRQVSVNKAFCEMTGFSEEELMGQVAPYPYWPAEEMDNIIEAFEKVLNGTASNFELIFQKKGGQRFPVLISTSILKDEQGNTINYFANVKDITEQRRKEAEIAAISKEIQDITNAVNESSALSITNAQDVIVSVNEQLCELSGYTEEELIGQNQHILNSDYHDAAFWDNQKEVIRSGKTWKGEIKKRKKNGKEYWVSVVTQPIFNDSGEVVQYISIRQDITERKLAELELERTKNFLAQTNQVAKVGGWDFNVLTGAINWADTTCEVYEVPYGYKPSYEQLADFYTPESWMKLGKAVQLCIAEGTPYDLELQCFTAKGKPFWIRAIGNGEFQNGQCVRLFGVIQDINYRKIVELEKEESELRLAVAIDGTEVGIWDWDLINNKVMFSKQWKAMLGYKDAEIENSFEGWKNLWHPDDADAIEKAIADHLNGRTQKYEVVHRCRHKNGNWHWLMARGKMLRDEANKPYRWIGTHVDITSQKQAEEDQKIAREQAEAASKAKSEFLANMSHEIRTPLNGVIGFTDLLTKTPLSPVQQQYVNSANVSGHTLLGIINDILDFSKIEAGMLELEEMKTDVIALLENSIDIVKFSAEDKELELLLDIDAAIPRFAYIDPVRTKQILANLLGNAVKFTQKGEVALKTVYQPLEGNQGKLSIFVRDTGIGISEEQKAKLFKSFSQADSSTTRKFGGTGLGLVISQMIAEKMGSKINIDSTPDVGTTFFFDITTHFEEGEKLDTTKIADVKRCLIIDDNANNRLILEQMLKQWEIETDSCANGFEALQQLESSKDYDVIICDYDMPYLNGIETIRIMKEKLKLSLEKQAVIILHSSLDNTSLKQKYEELGIRFRLNKPVKSHDLFNYLSHLDQTSKPILQEKVEQRLELSSKSEKMKILIAEDNALNMVLSKSILLRIMPNSEIYEAKNGLEVIEQYKTATPDLVFMDVQMPELDGIEATKRIRAMEFNTMHHLPIIALTAGALKEEKEKCLAAGMDDFLAKPLEPKKIELVLNKYLHKEENKSE